MVTLDSKMKINNHSKVKLRLVIVLSQTHTEEKISVKNYLDFTIH